MSEQEIKEVEEVVETEEKVEQEAAPESEAEVKARTMGWKPAEEWDGDKTKHLSAEQFLDRNERLAARADKIAKAEISRLEREVRELTGTISDLGIHMKKADKRAYERARKDLEQRMEAAVEAGDTAAFKEVKAEADALEEEVKESAKPAAKEADKPNPDEDPNFIAWHKENSWYGKGGHLKATIYANQQAKDVGTMYQGREFYEAITEMVKDEFPDLFENANRKKAAAVEGTNGGGKPARTKWEQVPKEDQAVFRRFVKQGVFEDTKEDREKYADDYLNG
jgi:hypothetical protein